MKRILTVFPLLIIVTLLTGCISIPIGGGDSIKLSKDGVSIKSKDGEEMTMKADDDDGSFSITGTDEDGKETNINVIAGGEIPEDFPSDIPIPKEAEITMTNDATIDGSQSLTVAYKIEDNDDVAKYGDLYRDYFKKVGYEKAVDTDYGDHIILSGNNDNNIMMQVSVTETDTAIEVIVSYMLLADEDTKEEET